MITLLLIVLFLLAILLETTLLPLPLTLYLLVILYMYKTRVGIFISFFSGILIDLFAHRLLGSSSVFFLISAAFWGRFSRSMHTASMSLKILLFLPLSVLYHLLVYSTVYFPILIRDYFVGVAVLILSSKYLPSVRDDHHLEV